MANWCENVLRVKGDATALKKFKDAAKGELTELSISKLHKMPDSVDAYCWFMTHFDLSGDLEAEVEDEGLSLYYWFLTRDIPPQKWLIHVSKQFSNLQFTVQYLEMNLGYGKLIIENGQVKLDESVPYESVEDEIAAGSFTFE